MRDVRGPEIKFILWQQRALFSHFDSRPSDGEISSEFRGSQTNGDRRDQTFVMKIAGNALIFTENLPESRGTPCGLSRVLNNKWIIRTWATLSMSPYMLSFEKRCSFYTVAVGTKWRTRNVTSRLRESRFTPCIIVVRRRYYATWSYAGLKLWRCVLLCAVSLSGNLQPKGITFLSIITNGVGKGVDKSRTSSILLNFFSSRHTSCTAPLWIPLVSGNILYFVWNSGILRSLMLFVF